jgi:hypothetical protein
MKMKGLTLFVMIVASLHLSAQTTVRLPIEFARLGNGECIVVKGLVLNGMSLNLIFDTGGSGSGIDQQTIDALGLKSDSTITARGSGGEMRIAHFGKRDMKAGDGHISINLSLFPLPPAVLKDGTNTNGLLGLGSLTDYHIGINFDDMVLTISEESIMTHEATSKVKTTSDRGVRFIEGSLLTADGKTITGPMYFDTGNTASPLIINQKNIPGYDFLSRKDTLTTVTLGGIGPDRKVAYKMVLPGLSLGNLTLTKIPVLVSDPKSFSHREDMANIGLKILRKFNIVFDKSGEFVLLSRSRYFNEKLLNEAGTADKTGTESLFNAIKEGDIEKVRTVWKSNPNMAKVTVMSSSGNTALQTAILAGQTEMAGFFIDKKVDLDVKNSGNGATALHLAVYKKNSEVVRMLLMHGADKTIKDSRGNTPLQMAEMLGNQEIVKLLQ